MTETIEIAGSGTLTVSPSPKAVRARHRRAQLAKRDVEPLEGTRVSLFNNQIPDWWSSNALTSGLLPMPATPDLASRVWVADRCVKLNAQQIATMPLRFHGPAGSEPMWVSNPDPHWYPNGVADAIHFMVEQLYGWGYTCQYVTELYATGFPRNWTVLDNHQLEIKFEDGERVYKFGDRPLSASRIIQIDRNPGARVKGTPALRAYAQQAWGLLAAGNQSMTVNQGGIPPAVLKAQRPIDADQAEAVQAKWMEATQRRNGAPPVLPPELDFETLTFDPKDMALLETQNWNALALATAFGVPGVLLNMALTGSLTYQQPALLGEQWWRFELRQVATRMMNAFTAQALPAGQSVTVDASDTFAPIQAGSEEDDPQLSQVAKASPSQQPRTLTAVGGGA